MMKYYHLLQDYKTKKNPIVCENQEVYDLEQNIYVKGIEIKNWNKNITFYYTEGEAEDYLANTFGWPLISENLKLIFDKLKVKGIQMLPLEVKKQNSVESLGKYYLLNICNITDALDLEKSTYTRYSVPPYPLLMGNPVLKNEKIEGLDIFRVKGDEYPIYLSERVKNEMIKNKITGVDFDKVDVV